MFDPTKPIQTRDGREAVILSTQSKSTYPILADVRCGRAWVVNCFHANGRAGVFVDGPDTPDDLINVPVKKLAGWQMRVIDEKREMDQKIRRLSELLNSPFSAVIESVPRALLQRQLELMSDLALVLQARIETFK